ncbi:MAG TPA: general secretion pathway protein GspB [Syntrophorhabdaceae bacterium]|jgi:general secretion pathway protein B
MSYILEALKKLEQTQRHEEHGRVAISFQGHPYRKESRRPRVWLYILSTILVLNMGFFAWWIGPWRAGSQGAGVKIAVDSSPGPVKGTEEGVTRINGKEVPSRLAPSKESRTAQASSRATPSPPIPEAKRPSEASRQSPPLALNEASTGVEPKPPPGGKVFTLSELPSMVGGTLPELRMSLHYYIAEPRSRFARINDVTLKEGQYLNESLKLDEVTRSGAIMNYKGWRFLVPIAVP